MQLRDEVQRSGVVDEIKRQVEVGTQAPIEVVYAASSLEQRRQAVFQAMNQVGIAENTLKNLTASLAQLFDNIGKLPGGRVK